MVGKWTNEPCSEVDEVVNHFWVLTATTISAHLTMLQVGKCSLAFLSIFHIAILQPNCLLASL